MSVPRNDISVWIRGNDGGNLRAEVGEWNGFRSHDVFNPPVFERWPAIGHDEKLGVMFTAPAGKTAEQGSPQSLEALRPFSCDAVLVSANCLVLSLFLNVANAETLNSCIPEQLEQVGVFEQPLISGNGQ